MRQTQLFIFSLCRHYVTWIYRVIKSDIISESVIKKGSWFGKMPWIKCFVIAKGWGRGAKKRVFCEDIQGIVSEFTAGFELHEQWRFIHKFPMTVKLVITMNGINMRRTLNLCYVQKAIPKSLVPHHEFHMEQFLTVRCVALMMYIHDCHKR